MFLTAMKLSFGLLLLASSSLGEDPTPLPLPPQNLTTTSPALRGSHTGNVPQRSERQLYANDVRFKLRRTHAYQLADAGDAVSTKNSGLAIVTLMAAGVVGGWLHSEVQGDGDQFGDQFAVNNWEEAAWETSKTITQIGADALSGLKGITPFLGPGVAAALAIADVFMPIQEEEKVTSGSVQQQIDQTLAIETWTFQSNG